MGLGILLSGDAFLSPLLNLTLPLSDLGSSLSLSLDLPETFRARIL
jgi:hypothetical protein